jgi:phospholipid/cholesterol/gamma-HCH transport system substrate-binding protein
MDSPAISTSPGSAVTPHDESRISPAWYTAILVLAIVVVIFATVALFGGWFRSSIPVTLSSDRAGLVMEPGGKVKLRGLEVGRVAHVNASMGAATLQLEIDPDYIDYIPANVGAEIAATTAFGAKYVQLTYPDDPSPQRLKAGQVLQSRNVTSEVNTVFQNLVGLLDKVDPAKLNSILSAFAEALRGQGNVIGQATSDANEVLLALNPRSDAMRANWQSLKGFSDAYGAAAGDILKAVDSFSTTAVTLTDQAQALDALLINVVGLGDSGISLLAHSKDNFVHTVNALAPTTGLLLKYSSSLTCLMVGAKWFIDNGGAQAEGGNGYSIILDAALAWGQDNYRYPKHLPVVGAKGGPGGKPGCGSLPDPSKQFPVRQLVTNTGWGSGDDIRVNPGIGFPGWANYFPVTRAVPEPPSIRNLGGGPAPGPIPYPGAPPYGAQQYAPDGRPLYHGLPPAPPPGAPREPGPAPGSEPFVPPVPAQTQPTPLPPTPPLPIPGPPVDSVSPPPP